jgi:probable HAF family extracellular repeat protein
MVFVLAGLCVTTAGGSSASAGATGTGYRLVDLGTLGGQSSYATGFNDHGHVVGSSQTATGDWHGFLWRGGRMLDLGTFRPNGINNRDDIIGDIDFNGVAYLRRGHRMIKLGSLGGSYTFPVALNDRGDVVGTSSDAEELSVPFLWSGGHMRRLPLSSVSGINNHRQISGGVAVEPDGYHAVRLHGRYIADLGAGPFNRSNSYAINEAGWIIGWKFSPQQDQRGVLWRGRGATDLGTLGGGSTEARSIDDRGQILGISQAAEGMHPFLWQRGKMTDLYDLGVTADGDVQGLNERGEILISYRPVFGTSHAGVYQLVAH